MRATVGERQVRTQAARLGVAQFTGEEDPARYERFDDIRVGVFGRELGWQLCQGVGPWHDPFDQGARLSLAETDDGVPIGILRALTASTAFPHRELFESPLEQSGLLDRDTTIGTLNALAVLPPYRRRMFRSRSEAMEGTAAHVLLRAGLRDLATRGVRVVLATVLGPVSARAFRGAGFQILERPHGMPGQGRFRVANVGLVLASPDAAETRSLDRARAYFAQCDRHLSAMDSVEALFRPPHGLAPEGAAQMSHA